MACMTRGSLVTSPIVPRELEECLPPLADYAPPEDQSGTTDIRVGIIGPGLCELLYGATG